MTDTLHVLRAARELLTDEVRWTQEDDARDEDGEPVDPCDNTACCWCLLGAVDRVRGGGVLLSSHPVARALHEAIEVLYYEVESVGHFNDSLTTKHADVLRVLDRAIERVASK